MHNRLEPYIPEVPEDPIDVAVCATLNHLRLPVRVFMPRLAQGLYMADRKISVSLGGPDGFTVRYLAFCGYWSDSLDTT
jgi:hypothetical protein